jgi:hypothetical protein
LILFLTRLKEAKRPAGKSAPPFRLSQLRTTNRRESAHELRKAAHFLVYQLAGSEKREAKVGEDGFKSRAENGHYVSHELAALTVAAVAVIPPRQPEMKANNVKRICSGRGKLTQRLGIYESPPRMNFCADP